MKTFISITLSISIASLSSSMHPSNTPQAKTNAFYSVSLADSNRLEDTLHNVKSYLRKGFQVINSDTAMAMLKNDVHLKIIDTRFPNVFAQGHLINAINIDKNDVVLLDKLDRLDKSENYLIYGNTDNENTMMIHMMRQRNFTGNIYDLAGGYKRWQEKNLPVEM